MSLILLNQINLDSGTYRFAQVGVSSTTAYWEERVLEFGEIFREIPLTPEQPREASVLIRYSNQDGFFSILKESQNFKNRELLVILADTERGEGEFVTIFKGLISNWTITPQTCEIEAIDAMARRFSEPVPFIVSEAAFPDIPDRTERTILPLILGTVTAPTGAVRALAVDEAISQAKYRYAAAQGTLKEVSTVYVYGEVLASGWSFTTITTADGRTVTVIDFDVDPFDATRTSEYEVTFDGIGLTDDGLVTGTAITNPALQLEAFLLHVGFSSGEINTSLRDDAEDQYNDFGVTGGVAVTEPSSIADVLDQFSKSFGLIVFPAKNNLIGMIAPKFAIPGFSNFVTLMDSQHIEQGSFSVSGAEELTTGVDVRFNRDFASGTFLGSHAYRNASEVLAQMQEIVVPLEMPYIRNVLHTTEILEALLFYQKAARQVASMNALESFYNQLEIGSYPKVTHYAGPANSGAGYQQKIFRLIGMGLVEDRGLLKTRLRMVDVESLPDIEITGSSALTAHLGMALALPVATVSGSSSISATISGTVVTSGLTNLWPFHNGSGQVLTDVVGGKNGQLGSSAGVDTNDPSWVTEGLSFDGADNYVIIQFFMDPSVSAWTLAIVLRSDANTKTIFSHVNTPTIEDYLAHTSGGALGSGLGTGLIDGAMSTGTWYMVYARFTPTSGTTGTLQLNVRRTGYNPTTSASRTMPTIAGGFHLLGTSSADYPSTGFAFQGRMAYMARWNRALSDTEMTSVFDGVKSYLSGRSISL